MQSLLLRRSKKLPNKAHFVFPNACRKINFMHFPKACIDDENGWGKLW